MSESKSMSTSTPTDLEYWMRRCGALVKENSDLGAEVSRLRVELERPPKEAEVWRQEIREELVKDWEAEWKVKFEVLERDRERLQDRLKEVRSSLELARQALASVEWGAAGEGACVACGRRYEDQYSYVDLEHVKGCLVGEALGRALVPPRTPHQAAEAGAGTPAERGWEVVGAGDE